MAHARGSARPRAALRGGSLGLLLVGALAIIGLWRTSALRADHFLQGPSEATNTVGAQRLWEARSHSRLQAPPVPYRAGIHGHVATLEGSPVRDATVCAAATLVGCCSAEQCVETDGEGRFSLPEQKTAVTTLFASAPGYVTAARAIERDAERPQEVLLEPSPEGSRLNGTVLDLYGGPVAGAFVSASSDAEEARTGALAISNAEGRFTLTVGRGAGRLCARAEAYSYVCSPMIAPSAGNTLVLMPAASIVGRVVSAATGEPVSAAMIRAANRDGTRIPELTTQSGADGSFAFDALPPGGYGITASSEHVRSDEVSVSLGVGEITEPLVLTASAAVRLTATVLLDERPCTRGQLLLGGPVAASEPLRPDGTAEVDGLLPGRYEARVFCEGLPGGASIDVGLQPVRHVWSLHRGAALSDANALRAGDPDARAAPVPGGRIKVSLRQPQVGGDTIRVFANARSPMPLQARQSGAVFIFDGLAVGAYQIQAFDDVEHAKLVQIDEPGESEEVELTLGERGTIDGQVLDAGGVPIADAWVSHFRVDAPGAELLAGAPSLSDSEGTFSLSVTSGVKYALVVRSPAGCTRVQAVGGQRVQLRLEAPGALSGCWTGSEHLQ